MSATNEYTYDVFISYSRGGGTQKWINKILKPALETYLPLSLHRDPKIFIDYEMPNGTIWETRLKKAITHSACMVGVFSPMYFGPSKEWCHREFATMYLRSKDLNLHEKDESLIFPLFLGTEISDFPELCSKSQGDFVYDYFYENGKISGKERLKLHKKVLKPFCKNLAKRIKEKHPILPAWTSEDWHEYAYESLKEKIIVPTEYNLV